MEVQYNYTIFHLGDDALILDFGNTIELDLNQYIVQLSHEIKQRQLIGITEIVTSYSTLTIHYSIEEINKHKESNESCFAALKKQLEKLIATFQYQATDSTAAIIHIPVCYENNYAPDLALLAKTKNISTAEIVELHCLPVYHVYMIGFLPGFAYMGEVDKRIQQNRKPSPTSIAPGSVGIAGKQTGIYPLASPGGWNIIGRTPLPVFNPNNNPPCFLQAGNKVKFYPISTDEFNRY